MNNFNFEIDGEESPRKGPKAKTPELLRETSEFVVIDKPAGMLSIPDRFGTEIPNVENYLRNKFGQIYVVHRLDKDTSGVMIFAKTEDAHRKLSQAFENRAVKKTYLAIVEGVPSNSEGMIDAPIGEDSSKAGKMKIDPKDGRESKTQYRIKERFRRYSLLELNPETGRQHQIRVHCAFIGHPLVVDPLYGRSKELKLSQFKRGYKGDETRPILGRLSLHAAALVFPDPISGEDVRIEAELPKDMKATLKQMRQHDCV